MSWVCKTYPPQGYSINGGRFKLNNTGNLPAQKIKVVWKIVKIESRKQSEINYSGSDECKKLLPDGAWNTSYNSKFKDDEQNLFLIVAWKYEGKGIKESIFKHEDYYWNAYWNPPAWAMTNRIDYQSQLSVVDNEVIPELKNRLGVHDRGK